MSHDCLTFQVDGKTIVIPKGYISITFSRSGGPGGQHVNKVETKATVVVDIAKAAIDGKIAREYEALGMIIVSSTKTRSKEQNRRNALEKAQSKIERVLSKFHKPKRKRTKVSLKQKLKRLEDKKHQSRKKAQRSNNGMP